MMLDPDVMGVDGGYENVDSIGTRIYEINASNGVDNVSDNTHLREQENDKERDKEGKEREEGDEDKEGGEKEEGEEKEENDEDKEREEKEEKDEDKEREEKEEGEVKEREEEIDEHDENEPTSTTQPQSHPKNPSLPTDITDSTPNLDEDADTIYYERLTKDLARTKQFISQVDTSIAELELALNTQDPQEDLDTLKRQVISLITVYKTLAYVPAKDDVIDEATSSFLVDIFVREQAGSLSQLREIKNKADAQLVLFKRSISDFAAVKSTIAEELSTVLKKIDSLDPNGGSQRNGTPDTLFQSRLDLCEDMTSGLVIQQDRVMGYLKEIARLCYKGQEQPLSRLLDALIAAEGATVSFTPDTENSSLVKTLLLAEVLVEVKGRYKLRSYGV